MTRLELGAIAYTAFQAAQGEDGDVDAFEELDSASQQVESWCCAGEAVAQAYGKYLGFKMDKPNA